MNIKKLIKRISKPPIYEKGTAVMWTDPYISKQLLNFHLNTENDLASRSAERIEHIVQWMQKILGKDSAKVLDLGCGPGLYTEKFAKMGHTVTGIDFSQNSIDYAKTSAEEKDLNINYICQNYLELDIENQYDLVIMIYCDFGALFPDEMEIITRNAYRALKQGGIFIFDAMNKYAVDDIAIQKNWEISEKGFWMDKPCICLSETFHYPENKVTMDQHTVIDEDNNYKIYRFNNHYFDESDVEELFLGVGFSEVVSYENLLEGGSLLNNKGVSFYTVRK